MAETAVKPTVEHTDKPRKADSQLAAKLAVRHPVVGSRVIFWKAGPPADAKKPHERCMTPLPADVCVVHEDNRVALVLWDVNFVAYIHRSADGRLAGVEYSATPKYGYWSWPEDEYA